MPIKDPVGGVVAGTEVIISDILGFVFVQCLCKLVGVLSDSFVARKATVLNNVGSELRKVKQSNIWIGGGRGGGLILEGNEEKNGEVGPAGRSLSRNDFRGDRCRHGDFFLCGVLTGDVVEKPHESNL